jgi:hypothetical protein
MMEILSSNDIGRRSYTETRDWTSVYVSLAKTSNVTNHNWQHDYATDLAMVNEDGSVLGLRVISNAPSILSGFDPLMGFEDFLTGDEDEEDLAAENDVAELVAECEKRGLAKMEEEKWTRDLPITKKRKLQ